MHLKILFVAINIFILSPAQSAHGCCWDRIFGCCKTNTSQTAEVSEQKRILPTRLTAEESGLNRAIEHFSEIKDPEKALVIFDVDNTVSWQTKHNEFKRISITYQLYKALREMKIHVRFISARPESSREQTLRMLLEFGYMAESDELHLMTNEMHKTATPKERTSRAMYQSLDIMAHWKASVRKQLAKSHRIVGTLDDLPQNLVGENTGLDILVEGGVKFTFSASSELRSYRSLEIV